MDGMTRSDEELGFGWQIVSVKGGSSHSSSGRPLSTSQNIDAELTHTLIDDASSLLAIKRPTKPERSDGGADD